MSLALIYARSASGDLEHISAQKRVNEAKAIKNDWETENLFEYGAANTQRIAEAITSGRIGIIYVTEPSRISRREAEILEIHNLASKHNVEISYTMAGDIYDSEMATLIATITAAKLNAI